MASSCSWCCTNITEDAVFQILLWLPVVSLLRFKSVCKSWNILIGSSDFVSQHILHHRHQKRKESLICLSSLPNYYPLFEDSSHPSRCVSTACLLSANKFELLDFPYGEWWAHEGVTIVGTCNGIICLRHDDESCDYLWNPAAKQFRVILEEPLGDHAYAGEPYRGFGFDDEANDYKLVLFCHHLKSVYKIYSLSTNSWRTVDDTNMPTVGLIRNKLKVPYRDGIFCWLTDPRTLLLFDFRSEVFKTIHLPDGIKSSSLELAIIRENIACIEINYDEAENWHGEVWMLSGYGLEESWNKLYAIGPYSSNWHWLMGYSRNGDFILLFKNGQLWSCDLVTGVTEKLPVQAQVQGPEQFDYGFQVVLYDESLVSVKGGTDGK